jgi:imidazolonepropionase-like amidohydrolase
MLAQPVTFHQGADTFAPWFRCINRGRRQPMSFALLLLSLVAAHTPDDGPNSVAIKGVTVIDATGAPSKPGQTVVVVGGRIVAVGRAAEVKVPDGTTVIDGAGKFLIPGLWDMHVHFASPDYHALFVVNGVTGVRDMHAFFPDGTAAWRDATASGQILGPRIVMAYAIVDGPKPSWPSSLTAANAEEGRAAVRKLKEKKADFVKVYSMLSREAFLAIIDEAKKVGLPVDGHVPESVNAGDASDAGMRTMEHLYGLLVASSTDEDKLRAEVVGFIAGSDNARARGSVMQTQLKALESFSEAKAQALHARLAKNRTWQVPTLTVLRALAHLNDEQFTKDDRLKYMPPWFKNSWAGNTQALQRMTAMAPRMRLAYQHSLKTVTALHKAGVPILAGTDTTNPYCFPGFSLHDELALLVEAGLTPMEALQAATRGPAACLGLLDTLGTLEVGKRADLVLLDADPLTDIRHTLKINAVILGGKLLPRGELDAMLAKVAATYAPKDEKKDEDKGADKAKKDGR